MEKNSYPISLLKTFVMTAAFITVSLGSGNVFAKLKALELPRGCHNEGYAFHYKTLTLLPAKAGNYDSVYFIYNKSNSTINLYQLKDANEHLGLNINNKIKPHKWGVYSPDEEQVRFACSIPSSKYDHGKLIDCRKALKVCEYTKVKYGLNNRGNYWMARSTTKNGAIRRSVIIGVLLTTE